MRNKILMLTKKQELHKECLAFLEQSIEIYEARGIQDALSRLANARYHLILISMQLDSTQICQLVETIRKLVSTPIMVLFSEKTDERKQVIKAGADVVLDELCEIEEIKIQGYALIRRYITWELKEAEVGNNVVIGSLEINFLRRTVYWKHMQVDVVRREFDFLYLLAATPGRVYTYSQIYRIVWREYPQDSIINMIYCLVHRLKKKLRKIDVKACDIICSVKQVGYCLKVNNE